MALKQKNNPLRSQQERKKEADDGESIGRERERERVSASKPQHRGGSKVCALHHNGHPVTNTDEAGCVMPLSQGLYLMGKQVVIAWNSVDVFSPFYLTAHKPAVTPFVEIKSSCQQRCPKKKKENKQNKNKSVNK